MHRYEFTSTIDDLLEAEKAERELSLRVPFRWAIATLGIAWLVAGVTKFVNQPGGQSLVWMCLGLGVLYYSVLNPIRRRGRIRRDNAPREELILEFDDEHMSLAVSRVTFTRHWDELAGFSDTPKGVLLYFSDGIKNWLPNRVFASPTDRMDFLELLERHYAPTEDAD